jgi:hypothetical protein
VSRFTDWTLKTVQDRCIEDGECWIWQQGVNSKGYPQACINGKGGLIVRRFVYENLMGRNLRKGFVVSSRCNNRLCCSPDCLVQKTRSEVLEGSYARGVRSVESEYMARVLRHMRDKTFHVRLDFDKAREIRARLAQGETTAALSKEFGVGQSAIRDIRRNITWREQSSNASVFTWAAAAALEAA